MAKTATLTETNGADLGDDDGTIEENETEEQRAARERAKLNKATVTLKWANGKNTVEFKIPKRRGRWNIDAIRELARDNYIEAIVALIGEDGWQKLKTVCLIGDDLEAFSDYAGSVIRTQCVP